MDPQIDTAQRRAVLAEIAKKLVLQINEIQPFQWDKHDDKDQAIVLAALLATDQQARREALEEAAKRARPSTVVDLLDAPCLWCGYRGHEYWQATTHDSSCIWHNIAGRFNRIAELDRLREGVEGI